MCYNGQDYEETGTTGQVQIPLYAGILAEFRANEMEILSDNHEILADAAARAAEEAAHPEQKVYTFLQGPKSWEEGRAWSGEWSNQYVRGNYFGNFGCGLCCMANIYCTLTEHTCSPWDMYEYARQVSGYAPSRKIGAIGWADMKVTLRKSGFDCTLNTKPESYEEFQQEIAASQMAVVLVSSRDDDTYWKKTGGHYVSISLYDASSDRVFLGDPADPDGNRSWIPLRYVYDALKTVSQYQYLLVQDYAEEQNQWMHDGITDAWGGM
ncbi:C39 family peptidase [Roseburia hominis]|uniref:C39 family peptidase n=1 Tax=Roseburia hominis TaxID=301301 RepID=UPI0026EA0731|nr:C39 family peptidase [Roseburia hominis]